MEYFHKTDIGPFMIMYALYVAPDAQYLKYYKSMRKYSSIRVKMFFLVSGFEALSFHNVLRYHSKTGPAQTEQN